MNYRYRLTIVDQQVRFDGPVYFGGVPNNMAGQSSNSFSGCIGDATLNGRVIDFSVAERRERAMLQSCDLTEHKESVYTIGKNLMNPSSEDYSTFIIVT